VCIFCKLQTACVIHSMNFNCTYPTLTKILRKSWERDSQNGPFFSEIRVFFSKWTFFLKSADYLEKKIRILRIFFLWFLSVQYTWNPKYVVNIRQKENKYFLFVHPLKAKMQVACSQNASSCRPNKSDKCKCNRVGKKVEGQKLFLKILRKFSQLLKKI